MTLAAFIARSREEKEDWKYTDLGKLLSYPLSRTAGEGAERREAGEGVGAFRNDALTLLNTTSPSPSPLRGVPPSPAVRERIDSNARLVFLNGVWQPRLSSFGAVPSCILMGDYETGYTLTLGEQTCLVAQPIELIFATDENAPQEITLTFSIVLGANARLTLLENYLATNVPTTVLSDIALHPSAKFVHGKIVSGGAHLAAHKVAAAKGSYYSNFSLLRGGTPARNEFDVRLEGEEAQASMNGIILLRGHEHADTTTRILHKAPRCSSRQVCKTVLDDASRGVFQGRITVAEGAQKSDGYQLSRALLLSDKAEMDAKPELEIFADDVKCGHGSSIGDLDDEAMFYLRSRGLSETEARGLLIEGFVSEIIDLIPIDDWRDLFRRAIKEETP